MKFAELNNLYGWEAFINQELRAITNLHWLELAANISPRSIGINVRRAKDFSDRQGGGSAIPAGPVRTPLSWFVESLKVVRKIIGFPVRAYVVSDGTEKDLAPLLNLENITFIRPGCAISDLLALAKTKMLIASGGSSFSAWAGYLGQMPVISYPGHSLKWFKLKNTKGFFVGEFDPASPPGQLEPQLKEIFGKMKE